MNIFTKTLIGSCILLTLTLGYSFTFGESKDIIPELSESMNAVIDEINNNRSLILNITGNNLDTGAPIGHSIVGFAYHTDSDAGRWVGVNFGWGPYNRASIGMNLNAMIGGYDKVEALHTFDIVYK